MKHSFPLTLPVIDNRLMVGGLPIEQLVERVGQTPFYAYDRRLIGERVAQLRASMPQALRIHYAIKANPMPALVQYLAQLVDGFDVASSGEMKTALDTVMPPDSISLAGPVKRSGELRQAVACGITVNLESLNEIDRLAHHGESLGVRPRVAVRINPDYELKSSGMKMGGGPTQFGLDVESVLIALEQIVARDFVFVGFHLFAGSQNLNEQAIAEAFEQGVQLARRLADAASVPLRRLNLGGGFGIPYFPGDQPLKIDRLGAALAERLAVAQSIFPETHFNIELGRFLVGEAGVYVCQVIEKKRSHGRLYLLTDGGLHHHLAACGLLGQTIRKNYPVIVANAVHPAIEPEAAWVVGPLCTPLDRLAEKMPLGHAQPGDWLAVLQSGAYGLTASPRDFLSHPHPLEVIV
jgi:diaminopimelate decarboxylase